MEDTKKQASYWGVSAERMGPEALALYLVAAEKTRNNPDLAAAAPEILEACKFAASVIQEYLNQEPDKVDAEMSEAYRLLEESVAKAEGRADW